MWEMLGGLVKRGGKKEGSGFRGLSGLSRWGVWVCVCVSSVKSECISSDFRDLHVRMFHGAHEREGFGRRRIPCLHVSFSCAAEFYEP